MIRTAQPRDLARILEIYDYARGFMERTGNASQWGKHFPPEELLREDIRAQRLFVIEEDGAVHGVFAFIIGDDPTYQTIEQGSGRRLRHDPPHRRGRAGARAAAPGGRFRLGAHPAPAH